MPILKNIQKKIEKIISEIIPEVEKEKITVEMTNNVTHGEITTNAAMILAKKLKVSLISLAQKIKEEIAEKDGIKKVEIAGAGFINITFEKELWQEELKDIVNLGNKYAANSIISVDEKQCNRPTMHIEFVSANPTGPMHAGHVRNAVLGDTIASLLRKVGYNVYTEYYINDAGKQVEHLAHSVYLRYKEALGHTLPSNAFENDLYPGDYLIPIGKSIAQKDGDKWEKCTKETWLPVFCEMSINHMMDLIRDDLAELGVEMDCYTSEKKLAFDGKVQAVLDKLKQQDDVYEGILTPPKGMLVDDWEERRQLLFRSTKYGDDIDRPLMKSDDSWTYFATDIAYHFDKIQRGFTYLINVLGADHCGYVKRLTAAVKAISSNFTPVTLDVKLFQIVNFFENGQPVKMSKRAGTFITSHDIVQKVGKDATRFMMVSKHNNTVIDFDFKKVLEQSQDNPIFYVQYAHSRIYSVFKHASEIFPMLDEEAIKGCDDLKTLDKPEEIAVIRVLAAWPKIVEQAAVLLEPHRITNYLYDLAGEFHKLWNLGKTASTLRFVDQNDQNATKAKLFLLSGVATILRDGLELLGITPLYRM
ncbi:MAG: arginine--tRNA ligase [Holosporales bacterium]|jgi:arginyl-tRNA synthetase|nr:arginine--tRNA ligase [Holosporales bacterium]